MYGAGAGAGGWNDTRGGFNAPQTASYEVSKKQGNAADKLPPMPTWDNARDKRELMEDDVEMNRMDQQNAQSQPFLASGGLGQDHQRYYNQQDAPGAGDMGTMQTGPYHNYDQHQQFVTSPVSSMGPQSNYPPAYNAYASPPSTVYEPNYANSIPPSYRTMPMSPPPAMSGVERKPVQGSFRNV